MRLIKVRKALALLTPAYWRALRHGVAPSIEHQALAGLDIGTLIDVGANRGQFTLFARRLFPNVKVFAFEPLAEAAKTFRALFANEPDIRLFVAAVGERAGEADMHVTERDDSSSLLPLAQQTAVFGTREATRRKVRVERLARFIDAGALVPRTLLKIDVQGYELEVLKGSTELLPAIDYVYVECSHIELYKGQPLAADVMAFLRGFGFALTGVYNESRHPAYGPVQADFLFSKPRHEDS